MAKRGFKVNKELLKQKIDEAGNVEEVAKEIGIDRSTLYRKINNGKFYIGELINIKSKLSLTDDEANDIFFN